MSFILDALRKSEHERQRQGGPGLAEVAVAAPRRPKTNVWATAAVVLLVVNLVAVGVLMLWRAQGARGRGRSRRRIRRARARSRHSPGLHPNRCRRRRPRRRRLRREARVPAEEVPRPACRRCCNPRMQRRRVPAPAIRSRTSDRRRLDAGGSGPRRARASVPEGPPAVTEYATQPGSVVYEPLPGAGGRIVRGRAGAADDRRRGGPGGCRRCTSTCTCTRAIPRIASCSSTSASTARARRCRKARGSSRSRATASCSTSTAPLHPAAPVIKPRVRVSAAAIDPESLDGLRLIRAFKAGILRLLSRQEHLNKINVFPVPDGDTGTNLAITHGRRARRPAAHAATRTRATRSRASPMPRSTARAAIRARSSRSSSSGWATGSGTCAALSAGRLRDGRGRRRGLCARKPQRAARRHDPLGARRDFAARVHGCEREDATTFRRAARASARARRARRSRARRGQLDALRKANVVDAGAQGFVELVSGFADYIASGSEAEPDLRGAAVDRRQRRRNGGRRIRISSTAGAPSA